MRKILRLAIFSATLILPVASFAVDAPFFGDSDTGRARGMDTSMQATCRDVVVSLDEGYGVASQETRVVCRDNR